MDTLANKIFGFIDGFINKMIAEKPFVAPTHEIKVDVLREYAKKYLLDTFIETGTFLGDTVYAVRNNFKKIISVELSSDLFNKAQRRFANDKHISILQGDSGALMGSILDSLKEPALFWLDGHYSGGITARGELDTPIIKELGLILNHDIKNHVILIDDARCFVGENDYPTIKELLDFVSKLNNDLNIKVENDIIRIYPGKKEVSYSEPWRHKTERMYKKLKETIKYFVRKYFGYDLRSFRIKLKEDYLDQKKILEGRAVDVIFDVGANVGQTTTKYKKMFPKAKIYGFEPFRRAFEKYANHFSGDKRISAVNAALSNKNGKAKFFVNDSHPTNSLLPIDETGPMNNYKTILQVEVPTETIDSFCERKKIQNIGILKIDVQGGELLVLEGAKEMLSKEMIDLIYTEVEFVALYENQPLFEDIEKFLKQYNYKFYKNYNLYNDKNNNPATGDAIFLSPKIALEMQT